MGRALGWVEAESQVGVGRLAGLGSWLGRWGGAAGSEGAMVRDFHRR